MRQEVRSEKSIKSLFETNGIRNETKQFSASQKMKSFNKCRNTLEMLRKENILHYPSLNRKFSFFLGGGGERVSILRNERGDK